MGPESVQWQAQNPFREGWGKNTPSWEEEAQNLGGWEQPLQGLKERPDGATSQNGAHAEKTGPRKRERPGSGLLIRTLDKPSPEATCGFRSMSVAHHPAPHGL